MPLTVHQTSYGKFLLCTSLVVYVSHIYPVTIKEINRILSYYLRLKTTEKCFLNEGKRTHEPRDAS